MPKDVRPSKFTELKGIDRISAVVHDMKCLFREITKDDYGIDGEIEVVTAKPDGTGFETTGGIIKVQSKSGESYVKQDTEETFSTPVTKNDLETWYSTNYPVMFIVYHPKDDSLYWKEVRSYVRSTPSVWQPPLKITFNKANDKFTTASYDAIRSFAGVSPPRISVEQKERLFSNLLLVKRMPPLITSAVAEVKDYNQIRSQIKGFAPPFCIIEDRLYTLSDLRDEQCVLRNFCNTANINDVPSERWSRDKVHRRNFVFLINQLLGIHLRRCRLRYNPHFDRNYFPRQDGSSGVFRQNWFNVRTERNAPSRIIAKYYTYGIDKFWRHLAVNLTFRQISSTWYLQILPKYFYTIDGEEPYDRDKIGPYTTRLKAAERNLHVLNHVLFWADVLSMRNPVIELTLDQKIAMVIEKMPLSGTAHFAISQDPALYEEEDSESSGQLELFNTTYASLDDQEMEKTDDELED